MLPLSLIALGNIRGRLQSCKTDNLLFEMRPVNARLTGWKSREGYAMTLSDPGGAMTFSKHVSMIGNTTSETHHPARPLHGIGKKGGCSTRGLSRLSSVGPAPCACGGPHCNFTVEILIQQRMSMGPQSNFLTGDWRLETGDWRLRSLKGWTSLN